MKSLYHNLYDIVDINTLRTGGENKDNDYVRIYCWWIREICLFLKSINNMDFYLFFFWTGHHGGGGCDDSVSQSLRRVEKKDDDYVRINCWWIREICWLIKSTNNIDFYLFFFLKGCHSGHSSMFPSPCMLTLCQYENQHVRTIHTGLLLVRRDGSPCSDGSLTFSSSQVGRQM